MGRLTDLGHAPLAVVLYVDAMLEQPIRGLALGRGRHAGQDDWPTEHSNATRSRGQHDLPSGISCSC